MYIFLDEELKDFLKRGCESIKKRSREGKRGFTVVELLVVVAIIGVLVAVSIPIFTGQLEKSRKAVCQANRRNMYASYRVNCMTDETKIGTKEAIESALEQNDFKQANVAGTSSTFTITDLCKDGGTITAVCDEQGGLILSCSKHEGSIGGNEDLSGASTQASSFSAFVAQWIDKNPDKILADKGDLYADYYQTHGAVQMNPQYKQTLVDAGLNSTLKNTELYWWTYPVTDSSGKFLYNVTYASNQSNPAYWNDSNRRKMNGGYVVLVNGKTYIRTNSGLTVEPASQNNPHPYQTEDALEQALISKGYKVVS